MNPVGRILIVEDEGILAISLKRYIERMGYGITGVATSAQEALESASLSPPALALVDIKLRGPVDGIEVAMRLRQLHGTATVFITAHGDSATIDRAAQAEPIGYIQKPIDIEELAPILGAFFREGGGGPNMPRKAAL